MTFNDEAKHAAARREAMTSNESTMELTGDGASHEAWIERAARIGYLAKGLVYLLIGGLAAAAALGLGGKTTGSEGALETIVRQPFGRVLLALVALGLVGYAVWRYVQGIADPEDKGTDLEGLTLRGYYLTSALIHTGLIFTAVKMIVGSGGSSGGGTEQQTATLMSQPFGRWLVGLVGLVVIGSAIYQFYRAYQADFTDRMDTKGLDGNAETWLERLGRFGLAARGVVFAIIGGFLISSALRAEPEQAKGLGESLATLESQPYGPWLLAVVALGLAFYGALQIAKGRLREIEASTS